MPFSDEPNTAAANSSGELTLRPLAVRIVSFSLTPAARSGLFGASRMTFRFFPIASMASEKTTDIMPDTISRATIFREVRISRMFAETR